MEGPAQQAAPTRRSAPALGAALLAVYLLLAVALFNRGLFTGGGTIVGNHGDPPLFIWYLQWLPFALGHHLNPLLTTYLHYPRGANLMWNTSIVFPALLLAPVTLAFGPITAYNVLCVLAVGTSAWCGYLAARRFTQSWVAAAVGGLLYGFSPYMISQSLGHAMLTPAFYPALMVVLADEILVRERRRAWVLGLLLGVATAVQFMTSTEILAMTLVMAVPALVAVAIVRHDLIRGRLDYALGVGGAALASFLVLAGYPLYVLFFGPRRVHGPFWFLDYYVGTLERFVVPSPVQLLVIGHRAELGDSSVYIGIPLLLLVVATVVWLRRRSVVVVAAVTLVCAMIFSLGGYLHVTDAGGATQVPLPWQILDATPFFNDILPIRVMLFGYLALGILVAVFLDRVLRSPRARWRVAGAVAVVIALVPLLPVMPFPSERWSTPPFFTSTDVDRLSSAGSVLVTSYPGYPSSVWQAEADFPYRSATGPVFTPGPGGWQWGTNLGALGLELAQVRLGAPVPAELVPAARQVYLDALAHHGVRSVVVGPESHQAQVAQFFALLFGTPGDSVGGVVVWYQVNPGALPDA
jgi:hypothetical protein